MTGCTDEPSNNSTSDGVDVVSNVFFSAEVDKSSADVDSSFVDVVVISINAFLSNEDFVVAAAAVVLVVLDVSFFAFSSAFVVILVGVIVLASKFVVSDVDSGLMVVSVLRWVGDVCL